MSNKEFTVTIAIVGPLGSGKSTAITVMLSALEKTFEITAQTPAQHLFETETYTFKARLK